ncbi:hypothetical protein V2W45_1519418 [Cenococcum geophilum]
MGRKHSSNDEDPEQRLRRAAEADAERSQPKTFINYLEACHKLSQAIEIITNKASTTQGNTTDPTNRQHPLRIEQFSTNSDFHLKPIFPSSHQLNYIRKNLHLISNHMRSLVKEIYKDKQLREVLGLRGKVVFKSHTNMGEPSGIPIEEKMEQILISKGQKADKGKEKAKQDILRSRSRTKGGPADQFCIYERLGGKKTAIMSIEYKAPHKFSLDNVVAGLDREIRPEGESFEFNSKWLAAAGYVFTEEAIIFLYIADDPSVTYYHLLIPKLDYREDDKNRLYLTAVPGIFTFIIRAARAKAPKKKKKVRHSTYRLKRENGFLRSPIALRSRGKATTCNDKDISGDDNRYNKGDDFTPDSPPQCWGSSRRVAGNQAATAKGSRRTKKGTAGGKKPAELMSRPRIKERVYYTQRCLLRLAYSGKHIDQRTFLRLIRQQLATDRGSNADWKFVLVYLGFIILKLPQYYDGGVYAGRPLFNFLTRENELYFAGKLDTALQALHNLRVLHKDPKLRNMLWDEQSESFMIINLKQAKIPVRQPLGSKKWKIISVLRECEPSGAFPNG